MKLDTNAHSVFLLHYHLILVVKYRRQVFTDEISERAKEIFEYIKANNLNIKTHIGKSNTNVIFREKSIGVRILRSLCQVRPTAEKRNCIFCKVFFYG